MTTPPTNHQRRLQDHNLRLFLGSQLFSQAGTWLQFVALAWLAAELTGSGTALGAVAVAAFAPLLVMGPWTGALADRVDKYRLLMTAQLAVIAQAVTLGAVVLTGLADIRWVLLLTLAYGVSHAVESPVRRAFMAELVEEDRILHAVSLTGAAAAVGRGAGPVLAGTLIATAGIGWCFIASAAGYTIALTALLLINLGAVRACGAPREPGAVRAGLRYAWHEPQLRIALLLTAVVATFGFNHQVLIPLLAHRVFDGGVFAYTLLYTAVCAGAVLGALSVARRRDIDLRFLAYAAVAFATANALFAVAPNLLLAVVASFLTGAAATLFITSSTALLQQRCAPAMRGRVMALSTMVLLAGLPIGAPIVGWVTDMAGPRAGLMVGSVAALLACALVLRRRTVGPVESERHGLAPFRGEIPHPRLIRA